MCTAMCVLAQTKNAYVRRYVRRTRAQNAYVHPDAGWKMSMRVVTQTEKRLCTSYVHADAG